jgi:hypothetical protein
MAFWEDLIAFNPMTAGPYWGGKALGLWGGKDDAQEYLQGQIGRQAAAKQKQLELLGRKKAPVMSSQMEARLKALEEESKPQPLVTDPEFQAQRAAMTTGGRQALAGVQARQKAADVSGGFSNIGSLQNIYDRLGTQLAQLGQQQTMRKEQKRDVAAQSRQDFANAQVAHENAMLDAQMAIEAGDAAALSDAYARMFAAQQQADQAKQSMILGLGTAVLGAATANPAVGLAGVQQLSKGSQQQQQAGQIAQQPNYYGSAGGGWGGPSITSPTYAQDLFEAPGAYKPTVKSIPVYQMRRGY